MKNLFKIFLLALFSAGVVGCKKDPKKVDEQKTPKAYAHGVPNGPAISKTIGIAGGNIETPDGSVSVQVPAGAVNANVEFKITPITSTMTSSTGQAFRLEPENVNFAKDLQITFNYRPEDLLGTKEEFLYLAYQDKDGYFHRALTALDKSAKKLTVKTTHFSDWYLERSVRIKNKSGKVALGTNEECEFDVCFDDKSTDGRIISLDVAIRDEDIQGWFVQGPGTVRQRPGQGALYQAPASIPEPKTVEVGVTVKGLVDKDHPDRAGVGGQVIVLSPLQLVGDEYFTWEFNGTSNTGLSLDGVVLANLANVLGTGLTGGVNLTINANKPGSYDLGNTAETDKFNIVVSQSSQNQVIYQGTYYNCNDSSPRYGAGKLNIERFDAVRGYIKGNFTATVYNAGIGCQQTGKQVTGQFKIKRKL